MTDLVDDKIYLHRCNQKKQQRTSPLDTDDLATYDNFFFNSMTLLLKSKEFARLNT